MKPVEVAMLTLTIIAVTVFGNVAAFAVGFAVGFVIPQRRRRARQVPQ